MESMLINELKLIFNFTPERKTARKIAFVGTMSTGKTTIFELVSGTLEEMKKMPLTIASDHKAFRI